MPRNGKQKAHKGQSKGKPKGGKNMEERSYKELRQEVKNDLLQQYPGAVLLTLEQCMKVYGLSDRKAAKKVIGAPRVPGERRVVYYIGDVASDIAKRRVGNV